MRQNVSTVAVVVAFLAAGSAAADPAGLACKAVRQEIADYLAEGGACPCPYNVAHDGHVCGGRSAWAKRQGSSPRCFADATRTAALPDSE